MSKKKKNIKVCEDIIRKKYNKAFLNYFAKVRSYYIYIKILCGSNDEQYIVNYLNACYLKDKSPQVLIVSLKKIRKQCEEKEKSIWKNIDTQAEQKEKVSRQC